MIRRTSIVLGSAVLVVVAAARIVGRTGGDGARHGASIERAADAAADRAPRASQEIEDETLVEALERSLRVIEVVLPEAPRTGPDLVERLERPPEPAAPASERRSRLDELAVAWSRSARKAHR